MSVRSRCSCIIVFYFDGMLRNPASLSSSERSLNNHLCFYVYVTLQWTVQNDLYIATVLKKGKSYVQQILTVAAGFYHERSSLITQLISVDVSRVSLSAFVMSCLLWSYSVWPVSQDCERNLTLVGLFPIYLLSPVGISSLSPGCITRLGFNSGLYSL